MGKAFKVDMDNRVELQVEMSPTKVIYKCPFCGSETKTEFRLFCSEVGEPCDWDFSVIECLNCKKELKIDGASWE